MNPYSPNAGSKPPELAGRDPILDEAQIALDRIRRRLSDRSMILYGLRGVGKTVLLNEIRRDAEKGGYLIMTMEAAEGRSLPSMLVPAMRSALLALSNNGASKGKLERALKALAGFVSSIGLRYHDVEAKIDFLPEKGLADSGELESDLTQLIIAVSAAAIEYNTSVLICIDEIQLIKSNELGALIAAFHKVSQEQLPVAMIGAGLPQILGKSGKSKTYSERLFKFIEVGTLDEFAVQDALGKPAERLRVEFDPEALRKLVKYTEGYPFFVQAWGKHCWDVAKSHLIDIDDVERASSLVRQELDRGFFRVRYDRLTRKEKNYLYAMASLGAGHNSAKEIADKLDASITKVLDRVGAGKELGDKNYIPDNTRYFGNYHLDKPPARC
jgi:hypothetical protein